MANSDNVLRCGLTPEHVDVAEVLAMADFRALLDPRWRPRRAAASALPGAVRDFALRS